MPLYRDAAIVLRTQKLGEADRIVTLLTRNHGVVRAAAKGVRRTTSRFGSRLEPGMVIDLQCYEGRTLDTVTQVETLAPYGEVLARDYEAWTAASAMLETAERLCEDVDSSTRHFSILAGGLAALATRDHACGLILDAYLLRALAAAGWAPSFTDCAKCGEPGPHRAFHLASGGSVCPTCRTPGVSAPAPETLELLQSLAEGDWDVADASEAHHRREGAGLVAAFLQWHIERGIRSLRLVERA